MRTQKLYNWMRRLAINVLFVALSAGALPLVLVPSAGASASRATMKFSADLRKKADKAQGGDTFSVMRQADRYLGTLPGEGIIVSNGIIICDRILASAANMVRHGIMVGDKVLLKPGFLLSTGIMVADRIMMAAGNLASDACNH